MKTRGWVICAVSVLSGVVALADSPRITTGSKVGTYFRMGTDLYKTCKFDQTAVLESHGSIENIERLISGAADIAIVQVDAIQYLKNGALKLGDAERVSSLSRIRLLIPLYNEEIHIIVRTTPAENRERIDSIHQLTGKRVNVGPANSGVAATASILADRLKIAWIPKNETIVKSIEDVALGQVDAAVIVGGMPYKLLSEMRPEFQQFIKLLDIKDERALEGTYIKAEIPAGTYPWITAPVSTYGVPSVLVTGNNVSDTDVEHILISINRGLKAEGALIVDGHQKWREVEATLRKVVLDFGIPRHPKAVLPADPTVGARPQDGSVENGAGAPTVNCGCICQTITDRSARQQRRLWCKAIRCHANLFSR